MMEPADGFPPVHHSLGGPKASLGQSSRDPRAAPEGDGPPHLDTRPLKEERGAQGRNGVRHRGAPHEGASPHQREWENPGVPGGYPGVRDRDGDPQLQRPRASSGAERPHADGWHTGGKPRLSPVRRPYREGPEAEEGEEDYGRGRAEGRLGWQGDQQHAR